MKSIIILLILTGSISQITTTLSTTVGQTPTADSSKKRRLTEIEQSIADRTTFLKLAPISKAPSQTKIRIWLQGKHLRLIDINLSQVPVASMIDIDANTKNSNPDYQLHLTTPTSGWHVFLRQLNDSGIFQLAHSNAIEGYRTGSHSTEVTVEIADAGHYFFINCPDLYANKNIDQTSRTLQTLIKLIDEELR